MTYRTNISWMVHFFLYGWAACSGKLIQLIYFYFFRGLKINTINMRNTTITSKMMHSFARVLLWYLAPFFEVYV